MQTIALSTHTYACSVYYAYTFNYLEHAHKLASQHGACCSFSHNFSYPDLACFTPVAPAASL